MPQVQGSKQSFHSLWRVVYPYFLFYLGFYSPIQDIFYPSPISCSYSLIFLWKLYWLRFHILVLHQSGVNFCWRCVTRFSTGYLPSETPSGFSNLRSKVSLFSLKVIYIYMDIQISIYIFAYIHTHTHIALCVLCSSPLIYLCLHANLIWSWCCIFTASWNHVVKFLP